MGASGSGRGGVILTDRQMSHRPTARALALLVALALLLAATPAPAQRLPLDRLNHLIVLYMENWSFDGFFGRFPGANGIANAGAAARQIDRNGRPYARL